MDNILKLTNKEIEEGKEVSRNCFEYAMLYLFYGSTIGNVILDDNEKDYIYSDENHIFSIIRRLCEPYVKDSECACEIKKLDEYLDLVKHYYYDKKSIKIVTPKCTIKARKMAGNIRGLTKSKYTDLTKWAEYKKYQKYLIDISKSLEINGKKIENIVVTGYVYNENEKAKDIRSWIEYKIGKKEYVIDFSTNMIINKEGFYFLRHAKPISVIESNNLKNDEKLFNPFNEALELDSSSYLIFRDEIMNELKSKQYMLK